MAGKRVRPPHGGKGGTEGDGGFPAGYRKNQAVPRKAILRKLMHHGCVILLDEFITSKC